MRLGLGLRLGFASKISLNRSYGLSWNQSTDVYERLGSLKDYGVSYASAPLSNILESALFVQNKMRRCLVADDGTVNYYLDPDNSALKADGITASDLAGTDGQVMVEIPKFYLKQSKTGDVFSWEISLSNLPGYSLHPAFIKDGAEVDYRYMSAFEGSMYDASESAMCAKASIAASLYASGDKMCSVIDQWAKTNEQRSEYRTMAAERATGWRQMDYYLYSAIQLLYLIEYANFNSQSKIGNGRTALSGGSWVADSYIGKTGLSVSDGNFSNSVANGGINYATDYMTYRGIENLYGNVYKMVDGIAWDGRWTGVEAAQPVYASNNVAYFNDDSGANMTHLCDADYIGGNAGYIDNIKEAVGFIPKSVGASTKLYDYYYQYSESGKDYWRVPLVGGYANNGSSAGAFSLDVLDAWTLVHAGVGARLCL